MTGKQFFNAVASGEVDFLGLFLRLLDEAGAAYCAIGGLAVNAYAEPVVSLDLDLVVIGDDVDRVRDAAKAAGLNVREFATSINVSAEGSDLRVPIQTDPRYQPFVARAERQEVLGYTMPVAAVEDVLQGKLWAYADEERRASKRQKDLADILRLVEEHPRLKDRLPEHVAADLDLD
jgi:hypothetical protein